MALRVALLYPYWKRFPPPRIEFSMDVVGTELPERLAGGGLDVTVYSRGGGGLRPRSHVERGVVHRHLPSTLDRPGHLLLAALGRVAAARGRPLRPEDGSALQFPSYALLSAWDMRRRGCDVAHVCIDDELLPAVRALNPRATVVLHMHDHKQIYRDPALLARRLACADLLVGCSEFVTDRVRRRFPELAGRCRTVTNAVDVERYAGAGSGPRGGKRLLFTGRLSPEKGVHTLLRAFELVLRRHPDAELVLVGQDDVPPEADVGLAGDPRFAELGGFYRDPGSYARHLRELLSPQARERVRFAGGVPHERLPEEFGLADVFVFPAIWDEPFGLPVVEAMAAGLPVVASSVGGIAETVEPDVTGLLCEPADVGGLAARIEALLDDPARRRAMGEAGLAAARRRFSWADRTGEWMRLYEAGRTRPGTASRGDGWLRGQRKSATIARGSRGRRIRGTVRLLRLVVTSDSAPPLDGLQFVLSGHGCDVVDEVDDGSRVLPLIDRAGPDAVLLEVDEAHVDGLACLTAIRRRYPRLKVIVLSSVDDPGVVAAALRGGADGYVLRAGAVAADVAALVQGLARGGRIFRSRPVSSAPAAT